MSSIGPDLPPHLLAKRKRQLEQDSTTSTPDLPSKSPDGSEKRQRIMGPAPPPAPLDQIPRVPADSDDSDGSDDGYGPSLPTGDAAKVSTQPNSRERV